MACSRRSSGELSQTHFYERNVESQIIENGKTNFMIEQTILRNAAVVFKAKVRIVMVDENGRPASMPEHCKSLWDVQK